MLRVTEIFVSIQGESTFAGCLFHFIRLTGCNLRCAYCDTTYAYEGGREMALDEVIGKVEGDSIRRVLITGGEPLLHKETPELASALLQRGFTVLVETNGSLDIGVLPPGVRRIVDLKCPSSGHVHDNRWENIPLLTSIDEVKFVIGDRGDYEWARRVMAREKLAERCPVLVSAAFGVLDIKELAAWMIEDQLDARLNVQLHKVIWPDAKHGV